MRGRGDRCPPSCMTCRGLCRGCWLRVMLGCACDCNWDHSAHIFVYTLLVLEPAKSDI